MKSNRNEEHKNAIDDLFNNTSVDSIISNPIINEFKAIQPKEEEKEESKTKEVKENKKSREKDTDRKTFNLPKDLIEDMKKIVYMNRDIKDNTEFVIKALRKEIKACQNLIDEYNTLKGGGQNE